MPLVTTLQERNKPVCFDDFNAPGSVISLYNDRRQKKNDVLDLWNEQIQYTPLELSKIFKQSASENLKLSVVLFCGSALRFVLRSPDKYCHHPTEHYVKQQVYYLSGENKSIGGSDISLDDEERGRGRGRRISTEFIELNVALGIEEFKCDAQRSVGGYAWAKMGYYFDKDSSRNSYIYRLPHILDFKLELLKNYISQETYEEAKKYTRIENPDDLYHLTRLEEDLSGKITEAMLSEGADLYSAIQDAVKNSNIYSHDFRLARRMVPVVKFCKENNKPLTIGKLLLTGKHWEARVDYRDDIQMQRISDYVGGFKYSKIVP